MKVSNKIVKGFWNSLTLPDKRKISLTNWIDYFAKNCDYDFQLYLKAIFSIPKIMLSASVHKLLFP